MLSYLEFQFFWNVINLGSWVLFSFSLKGNLKNFHLVHYTYYLQSMISFARTSERLDKP